MTAWLATLGQLPLTDVSQMSIQVLSQLPSAALRYCHLVMAAPPLPPAVQLKSIASLAADTVMLVGFSGVVEGVTVPDSSDSPPLPMPLTARILNL